MRGAIYKIHSFQLEFAWKMKKNILQEKALHDLSLDPGIVCLVSISEGQEIRLAFS